MTEEQLGEWIVSGKFKKLAKDLESLSEKQRRSLSKTASTLRSRIRRMLWEKKIKQILTGAFAHLAPFAGTNERFIGMSAEIAVLGVCPVSETKKIDFGNLNKHAYPTIIQVMCDRRPEWADEWIEFLLDKDSDSEFRRVPWQIIRQLIQNGVIQKPKSEGYAKVMSRGLNGWHSQQDTPIVPLSEKLRREPDLLEDVWRLFKVESYAFTYESVFSEGQETWATALKKLSNENLLNRDRLLDECLGGLQTGFKLNHLTGFARLYGNLNPTPDENASRQATFTDLLSVKVSQVAGFAMKMLKEIEKAKKLDDLQFVTAVSPLFDTPTKGPAKSALSLFKKIAKRSPELRDKIAEVVVNSAILHPADDIVVAVIELISGWQKELSKETMQTLADATPELPAAAQLLARELIQSSGLNVEDEKTNASNIEEQLADLRAEIEEIDECYQRLAGLDEAVSAIESGSWPGPLTFTPFDVPVLTGVNKVVPINSIDELRDVIAHAVEQVDSALDFERILDAICRLGRENSPEFDRLAAPLTKRIIDRPYDEAGRGITTLGTTLANLATPGWRC